MFHLQRTMIRPKTEHSPGTFNDCALYGIPYHTICISILHWM